MWYYAREGKPVGPFDKVELLERARRGDFGPDDYVWHPDFGSEWRLARDVEGIFEFPGFGRMLGGSGGTTPNAELTRKARESLRGNWPAAVGATLVVWALMGIISGLEFAANRLHLWWASLISSVLTPIVLVGYLRFHNQLIHQGKADLNELFRGFQSWLAAPVAGLITTILVILWLLLFLVPVVGVAFLLGIRPSHVPIGHGRAESVGVLVLLLFLAYAIWVSLRYSMVLPVIADDPAVGPFEAVRRGVRLVRGHYWKLFCFHLRYLGWFVLATIPCCLGWLWALPYYYAGVMHFYNDLKPTAD